MPPNSFGGPRGGEARPLGNSGRFSPMGGRSVDRPLGGNKSVDRPAGSYRSVDRPTGGTKSADRPSGGNKSADRPVPTPGPTADRRPPSGGDGHGSRPVHHPRWPHRPGGPIIIDEPDVASGGAVVPPSGAAVPPNGAFGPPNNPGGSQRPPAPGNPTARVRGGVPPAGERRYAVDEVVVEVANTGRANALEPLIRKHRLARLESFDSRLTNTTFYRLRITDRRPVPTLVAALENETTIRAVQPNYFAVLQEDSARTVDPAQYVFDKLQLLQTHTLATGDKVLIAVIDSGIDGAHPELAGMIADSFDALATGDKVHPHGTAIAGAIVSHAKLMGIAPAARILAVRAFAPDQPKSNGTSFAILKGIEWAAEHKARVINMSFAGPRDPAMLRHLAAARGRGIVLIAAAGNAGPKSPPLYPAADPNVIAVTATDADDQLFKGANWGPYIAIAAPGVDLLLPRPGSAYQMTTGTSFAAAEVSGAVALLLERGGDLDPDKIRQILMSTARDLGPKGFDPQFGAGLIDLYQAVLSLGGPGEVAATTGQNPR